MEPINSPQKIQKYAVNQYLVETIVNWVSSGQIAIPEIQRPFVWDAIKVRDLMDSLYQGYPVGYLIVWQNPDVRLKDGGTSMGKRILIDGQQRVTALMAAILGRPVVAKDYSSKRIVISFNPVDQRFEVYNPAIERDSAWIKDISPIITNSVRLSKVVREYCDKNPEVNEEDVEDTLETLKQIPKKQIGIIELDHELDIETVTEVFIRINSKGVVLSQADFAMTKIAANEKYNGPTLRKCIDYFCQLCVLPADFAKIRDNDPEFARTHYFAKMSWLQNEHDDLYDPDYGDVLRVAFTLEFNRGRISDLVSLLSGRNFETRSFEDEIAERSFGMLEHGLLSVMNETNFKRFLMIVRSAGFIVSSMLKSQNVLNFAYLLFLRLRELRYQPHDIETYVRRWMVMAILTGRYAGTPETAFERDIRQVQSDTFKQYLSMTEAAELSDAFWDIALPQRLNTSSSASPLFSVFLASQVKARDKGFLSRDITVFDLLSHRGDTHHIFPRDYLKSRGLARDAYNQVANFAYMQSEINIQIGNRAPIDYLNIVREQCAGGPLRLGMISSADELAENFRMNCIPEDLFSTDLDRYDEFLETRRHLIARKIRDYYFAL